MSATEYRGVVRGGSVVLADPAQLADGTEVVVMPVSSELGSPAAVLAAVQSAPHVPAAWVDEFEQLLAQGRRPPTKSDPFQDTP
jgi:hypothetical protein